MGEILHRFSSEDVTKLWLARFFTFLFMFLGFMRLTNLTNTMVMEMKLPLGPVPIQTWSKYTLASLALAVILWIVSVLIAYLVGIVHLALTFLVLICGKLLMSNKEVLSEGEKNNDKKKKEKKTQ